MDTRENIWTENEIKIGEKSSEDEHVKGKLKGLLKKGIIEQLFYLILVNMSCIYKFYTWKTWGLCKV